MLGVVDVATGEITPQTDAITFDDFWLLYPRKCAKKDARRAWERLSLTDRVSCLTALVEWNPIWRDKETQFLPYPATYLNGERWEDEIPREYRTSTSSSHLPYTPVELPRGAMPQKVKDMIARLKGKS